MAEAVQQFLQSGAEEAPQAYSETYLNADCVKCLLEVRGETISVYLTKALQVTPTWTNTRTAVRLKQLTGIAYVGTGKEANDAYVYSIALVAELDPGRVVLGDRQAEVAFALADVWAAMIGRPGGVAGAGEAAGRAGAAAGGRRDADANPGAQATNAEEEEEEEDEDRPLAWEPSSEPLPEDLRHVLRRLGDGTLQLDARGLLEAMPHWEGLKSKPEANNHKGDASKKLDKVLRTLQQKVLSLMRLYPMIHQHLQDEEDMKEEAADQGVQQLGQQFWALLAQLEQAILLERRKHSLPVSIKPEGLVLFDVKELRAEPKGTPENQKRNFR